MRETEKHSWLQILDPTHQQTLVHTGSFACRLLVRSAKQSLFCASARRMASALNLNWNTDQEWPKDSKRPLWFKIWSANSVVWQSKMWFYCIPMYFIAFTKTFQHLMHCRIWPCPRSPKWRRIARHLPGYGGMDWAKQPLKSAPETSWEHVCSCLNMSEHTNIWIMREICWEIQW